MPKKRTEAVDPVEAGALAAEELAEPFPEIERPVRPPFPPEEARSGQELPAEQGWSYEPKWDGFRCLAFRSGDEVLLQSKAGQPLGRYFPELISGLRALGHRKFVLDGEIVIFHADGQLAFDELLMRIHPAESRIKKLSRETPVTLMCFDLLVDEKGRPLVELPRGQRRDRLTEFLEGEDEQGMIRVSPTTLDRAEAEGWMQSFGARGLDGVVAKKVDSPYLSGERTAMVKVKRMRTADCVVGGFRYAEKGGGIGSLLLGLYNSDGALDHVGYTSSFNAEQKQELKKIVEPLIGGEGFTGKAPGGPSRWSTKRSSEWNALEPKLVCEVQYDHFSGGRFRHGTKFLRWRPEKRPEQCAMDQLR
ncbi:MAG: ATP-dependent DNA ligase [Acidobacteriales bacterium]|nr:ATP-dependent DNA ligase [Terriglobales bacterium]